MDSLWERLAFAGPALYPVFGEEGRVRKVSVMAEAARGAAQVNSLEISPVARGISAGRVSVCSHVVSVKKDAGVPGDGMKRTDPAEMALRARWTCPPNAVKVGPMA